MNIRIVILAIAAIAFVQTNAGAQTTTTIRNTGTKTVVITENENSGVVATYEVPKGQKVQPRAKTPDVVFVTGSAKRNPRLVASYDVPSDLYDGNDVMINDGVEKNKKRNINYLDFNGAKVPNDGGQFATK